MTTSFTTEYNEEIVNSFIDGMTARISPARLSFRLLDEGVPLDGLQWNKEAFPIPGMLRRLKEQGLKISVWINPYIAQRSALFDEGAAKGYLLKRKDGTVWQGDLWQPGMGIVDFTNPEACAWYAGKLRNLLAMGVDTFKTDFGERIPTDVVYYDGSDPYKMHNYYSYLYNRVVFSVLKEEFGENNAVVFARSATAGSQQYPVHWGGDCFSSYQSMAETLRGGLSLGLSAASGSGPTTSGGLKRRLVRTCINAGSPLASSLPTAACTAIPPTGSPGSSMKRPLPSCASSPS